MSKTYLVTGGAGFIGSNAVKRLVTKGEKVIIFDNLSRQGARLNIEWLQSTFGKNAFEFVLGDIRDADAVRKIAATVDVIIHLAGQVAVTTSVIKPREDFEINALGTFNVLEAARESGRQPIVLYASTNKVYGGMENVKVLEETTHYRYADFPMGISEEQQLDFHSPYGCSKGCGDQYVRDYARIYDIPCVVMRQSCIYGTRQFGIEDQGWVAWFIIAVLMGKPITIYGDGKQVRDVLFVEDLLDAYDLAIGHINEVKGRVFNIGGGPQKTMAIWKQFGAILENMAGHPITVSWADWRPGDQKIYVSDIRSAQAVLGWSPVITPQEGVEVLFKWVQDNRHLF